MYAETFGCMCADFGCMSMEWLGAKYAVVGCKVSGCWVHVWETFGCMYAVVGCKYAETFGCMDAVLGCKLDSG